MPEEASFPHMVERGPLYAFDLFKMGRAQARHFFELGAEMLRAAVSQSIGYFAESKFIINDEFLDFLNFLQDNVFFNRNSLDRREQGAEA